MATIVIVGCASGSSPRADEADPVLAPSTAPAEPVSEPETTAPSDPFPNGSATKVEEKATTVPDPVETPLETPPVLEVAPTSVKKKNPVIQEEVISVNISPTVPAPENPVVQGWIQQAKEDLAQRLSTSIEQVELIRFEAKVWPDPGLGCPQPGMNYIQVPQEGYLIVLRSGDKRYNYRWNDRFRCNGS